MSAAPEPSEPTPIMECDRTHVLNITDASGAWTTLTFWSADPSVPAVRVRIAREQAKNIGRQVLRSSTLGTDPQHTGQWLSN